MYRLCYVDDFEYSAYSGLLYFTDNFEHQWGDDWNDAPYQHNAGEPYCGGDYGGNIRIFGYTNADVQTPSMQTGISYSVEDINSGIVPWLFEQYSRRMLFAGASIAEARKFMREIGAKFGELK